MIRIICGGVFDRFPKLQFVIGHMGEGLPFFFQRLDIIPMAVTKLKRPIIAYLKENVHYTFSGMNFPPTFLDLLLDLVASTGSCSRPTIPINPCRRRARSWSKFPSVPRTKSALRTVTQSGFFDCDIP